MANANPSMKVEEKEQPKEESPKTNPKAVQPPQGYNTGKGTVEFKRDGIKLTRTNK